MEDPVIVALRQERDALREENAILRFNLKVAIGKLPQDLPKPTTTTLLEIRAALENDAVEHVAQRACNALKLIDAAIPRSEGLVQHWHMRREISRTHQPGFMWDAAQGVYLEADARFRERIKIDYEFRERMLNISNSAGSTMHKLYIDDACMRIEHMTQRHEINQVAIAIQGPGRVNGKLEEPDDSYKQRLQQYLRTLT